MKMVYFIEFCRIVGPCYLNVIWKINMKNLRSYNLSIPYTWPSYTYYLGIQKLAYTGYARSCVQFLEVFWLYSGHFLRYCKTSNRCATKNSRIFEIATELVHELISAANNSCNQKLMSRTFLGELHVVHCTFTASIN